MAQHEAKLSPIRAEALNYDQYLLSLLQEAYRFGLIDQVEVQGVQAKITDVLKDVIISYTGNDSSSLRVETVQNLLLSVFYCVDAYCMSLDSLEDCISALRTAGMKEIYKKGLELVRTQVEETKRLYAEVKATRLDTRLIAYNTTIDEAIPDFFAHYDVMFNAHDTMAGIDYPLASDEMGGKGGIRYIRQYLERLSMENRFCQLFAKEDIGTLLENYGRIYRIECEQFLLNIFAIVLYNSVFSVMLGNDPRQLAISASEIAILDRRLKIIDHDNLPSLIDKAIDKVIAELRIADPGMAGYIHRCEQELAVRLCHALEQGSLDKLAITDAVINASPTMIFEQGESMDGDAFRLLVKRVLDCADTSEKIGIIRSGIDSLADFLDIFDADCLFADEYLTLFELLGDTELSLLARIVFVDELRDGRISLAAEILSAPGSDAEWKKQFVTFIRGIGAGRLGRIEKLANEPGDYLCSREGGRLR